jgi:predicted enzyme related to lactoylglutathione lyase
MTGRVVHFEITADNVERAHGFYRDAFGWDMTSVPGMAYTMVVTTPVGPDGMPAEPGSINGGMLHREGPLTSPILTVDVDDIDDALARLEKAGGKTVIGRQEVGDMGFSAYFEDTEGNLLGLWQATS